MIKNYNREDFEAFDFDLKCAVIEELLTDDFFRGQTDLSFTVNDIDEKTGNLVPLPPEIQESEDELFNQLIIRLTDQLFRGRTIIELNVEKFFED